MSTFTSRAWATIKAVMLAESASPSAGTDPATKDYVDNLVVTRHETLTAPAAGGTNIAVQATDDIDTTTFSAQPDYPRNIAVTFGANWPATVHVYVEGKGADGETLKEIIQASQGTTVNGVEAFATVTRYFTTEGTNAATATPTTDSVTAGAGVTADLKLAAASATVFGVALDTSFRLYWVIVPVTLLMLLGAANLFRTRTGRAFIAIRDRDISAEVLGIPLLRYKLLSFGLSSFYAGVAGGLWAYFFRVVTPESFPLLMSIFFLAAIIVGGMGSILGSILGAVFMTMVPELLKLIVDLLPGGSELTVFLSPVRTMVFGLLIIVFLVFEPQGLAQMWRRLRRFFHLWPFRN